MTLRLVIWQKLVQNLNKKFQKLKKRKRKPVFNISSCLEKKRKLNITSHKQSNKKILVEKRLWIIHGSTKLNKNPVFHRYFRYFYHQIIKLKVLEIKLLKNWSKDLFRSKEAILHSLNLCYSCSVLGKSKYLSFRKANQQATFKNSKIANCISWKLLAK